MTRAAAIVGIGCRFPGGATSPERFWNLLRDGVEAISEIPSDRFDVESVFDPDPGREGKMYSRRGGFLEEVDRFDAAFFGISPREASRMDPQHRLLLEIAYEALEDAGLPADRVAGSRTGVFVGFGAHDYTDVQAYPWNRRLLDSHSSTGGATSIAANRISYALDLRGPSFVVDTACSSGLTAVHLALRALRDGDCDLALAGAGQLNLTPEPTIGFCKASMISRDGHCYAFDARANGYVRSEGGGLVVLKPLDEAVADRDRIYAVLVGTAVNQDGKTSGMTVPSADAQAAMLEAGLVDAGLGPEAIQYAEAHGTGTPVGDPIEARALGTVFGQTRGDPVAIGSVKTNLGHLESAAGAAGLIKAVLALYHQELPPSLNFEEPNRDIDFGELGLRIVTELEPWPSDGAPAVATVNSFGFGGANANAVLQEAPGSEEVADTSPVTAAPRLLPISARSPEALDELAGLYGELLQGTDDTGYSSICRAAARRRAHHDFRLAVVAPTAEDACDSLRALAAGEPTAWVASNRRMSSGPPGLAFVFTGMGPQWWAMGRELAAEEPVFAAALERCDQAFAPLANWSLLEELHRDEATSRIERADIAQVTNAALQIALSELWASWGVTPDAVVGHSVGEVAAAHVAGALTLEDTMLLVHNRSRLLATTAGQGTMLAVGISQEEAETLLGDLDGTVSLAAVNAPSSVTLSGDPEALEQVRASLEPEGRFVRFLSADVPYHSPKMDPLRDELLASFEPMRPRDGEIPFVSVATATWQPGRDLDAAYWWRNVRQPVRFADAIDFLADEGIATFLEIGPHPVLSISIKESLGERGAAGTVLPSLRRGEAEREQMLRSLAALYAEGREPRWETLYPGKVDHVDLPTYPWQRERHWFESMSGDGAFPTSDPDEHPLLGRRLRTPEPRWEVSLADDRLAYLEDHVIQGTCPLPAAAYVEMGLAASRRVLGHAVPAVENVDFRRALFLGPEPAIVQVTADPDSKRFDIHSTAPDPDSPWTLHATGVLAGSEAREQSVDLDGLRVRCPDLLERDALYEHLATRGYEYGPAFRGLEWAACGHGEALGALTVEAELDTGPYELHPSLLDGAFQLVIVAAAGLGEDDEAGGGFLPIGVREIRVHGKADSRGIAHARVLEQGGETVEGDVDIVAEDGTLLVAVRGLLAKRLDGVRDDRLADWLYELRWEEQSAEVPDEDGAVGIRRWLVVGGDDRSARQLASALELEGASCTIVPSVDGHLEAAIGLLPSAEAAAAVYLGALDTPAADTLTPELLLDSQVRLCGEARELATALTGDDAGPRSLVLVTSGAEQATGTDELRGLAQTALWGLGRVAARELPLAGCRLIDLPAQPAESDLSLLAAELLAPEGEDEVALRDAGRYVRRLRRLAAAELAPRPRPASAGDRFRAEVGSPGMLESVRMASVGRVEPGPGQVEIAVVAASLNFRDVMLAMGLLPQLALAELPGTDRIGLDCAGTVTAVGPDVGGIEPGDEVIAVAYGTAGSHVTTAAELVFPKPAGLDFEAAASVPVAFVTAYISLVHLARLRAGERVLIHAATGGVGLAAIQVARDLGAEIFATAGNPEKRDYLRSLGIEEVFDSRTLAFADEIRERTNGEGVDVVLNSLAGEAIGKGLSALAPSGRFVELGKRDIYEDSSLRLLEFRKNLSYFAVDLDRLLGEQPELVGSLFREVFAKFEDGTYEALPRERFSCTQLSDALRHMAQAKHIGKVVIAVEDEPVQILSRSADGPRFREDGTYLISGGLGGFGLAVAGWLAARGAGTVVLAGRSEPGPEAIEAIETMRSQGTQVEVVQADVSRAEQVAELISAIRGNGKPLRGVVHAAMVLDDGLLPQLDHERFERVLAPKVAGAWNLHDLTKSDHLDFFVAFSSISSLFGNVGQGNYAAANSFLDAFAQYRESHGLPALTVNWGALAGIGYLSRQEAVADQLARQGFHGFSSDEAAKVLGEVIDSDRPQVMAARVEWERWAAMAPADAASPRLRHLVPHGEAGGDGAAGSELARLLAAPSVEMPQFTEEYMQGRIGVVLGTGSTIDRDIPLSDLGLDSLMAVELLATLKSELGVEVPVVQLLQGVSLADLAGLVVTELEPRRTSPGIAEQPAEPSVAVEDPVDEPVTGTAFDGDGHRPELETPPESPPDPAEAKDWMRRRRWTRGQRIVRSVVRALVRMGARVEVEGLEHVPASGAFVLAGNHLSMLDIPVGWPIFERAIIPVVTHELRRTPWLRWVLSGVGHAIYLRRGEGDEDALARGLTVLRAGGALLIAPEGYRSRTRGLQRGSTGAAYLATRANVPVVPVVAWGQEDVIGSWRRLRRAPVRIRFGSPLHFPSGQRTGQELREYTDRIMAALASMLPAEYRGVYADAAEAPGARTPEEERTPVGLVERR